MSEWTNKSIWGTINEYTNKWKKKQWIWKWVNKSNKIHTTLYKWENHIQNYLKTCFDVKISISNDF